MPLGETLVAANLITEDDVVMALARQRKLGGTLGDNLVGLGRIAREQLEAFLETGPPKIGTVAETFDDALRLDLSHQALNIGVPQPPIRNTARSAVRQGG